MVMNLTLCSLSVSFIFSSPMISPSSSIMKYFFTNFFLDHSNLESMTFSYSSFINFLKTPIAVEKSNEYNMIHQKRNIQQYSDHEIFNVIGCTFQNCNGGTDWDGYIRGGAIKYICGENKLGNVSIYSSTFENCQTTKGDGGAIFVCRKEVASNFDSAHTLANYFNSSYCCYSKCTALGTEVKKEAGYGPVMFIFAKTIEIFYSTAAECPKENGQSYGAQFDLKSDTIRSSYINSTKGCSEYCCAMEYRSAQDGYFKYQTFAELTGGFLTSFTDLVDKLDISFCNYINDIIQAPSDQNGAFIYVRNCDVSISNFCFVGIQIKNGFDFVHFSEMGHSISLSESFVERNIEQRSIL